ncbi:MAG TPA: hypothetical protein VH331_16700 [Allosphingosinicella sp.]|jgi:hypothetical protein|nr:hypothetical protein [Allosphingosinicella sp.]
MTDYRLHFVEEGHLTRYDVISCPDDRTAIMWAEDLHGGKAAELWCGDRLVRRFEPQGWHPAR